MSRLALQLGSSDIVAVEYAVALAIGVHALRPIAAAVIRNLEGLSAPPAGWPSRGRRADGELRAHG
jgi:hypothetical protein